VFAYSLLQVWRKPLPVVLKDKIMDPIGASSTWRWYGYENSFVNMDGIMMQSVRWWRPLAAEFYQCY
jgi:hypothetical protein